MSSRYRVQLSAVIYISVESSIHLVVSATMLSGEMLVLYYIKFVMHARHMYIPALCYFLLTLQRITNSAHLGRCNSA